MKKITSEDNRIYKNLKQLQVKKYRDRAGEYLIEGENAIREAIRNGAEIVSLAVREDRESLYKDMFGEEISGGLVLDGKLFDKLSQTDTSQGILASVRKPDYSNKALPEGNIVVLDRLQDPGNIGTIIRTCDAAGISAVIAIKGTADVYSPKVVRSAAGSLFRVPVFEAVETQQAVRMLKEAGRTIIGTSFDTDVMYYEQNMRNNIAIVIGNEGNGMSEEFMQACDVNIKIPMKGNIESLNAAVAAGILIYETIRQER